MEMNEATVDEFLRGSLLTDDLVEKPCNSSSSVNKALSNAQWCENCEKEAKVFSVALAVFVYFLVCSNFI